MTRVLATLAAIGVAALMAFGCDNEPNPVSDLGPDVPACTVPASTDAQDACTRFQDALCDRALECMSFGNQAACKAWFADTYGDCSKAGTKPALTDAQNDAFVACLCAMPLLSCRQFEEKGLEVSIPECGQF